MLITVEKPIKNLWKPIKNFDKKNVNNILKREIDNIYNTHNRKSKLITTIFIQKYPTLFNRKLTLYFSVGNNYKQMVNKKTMWQISINYDGIKLLKTYTLILINKKQSITDEKYQYYQQALLLLFSIFIFKKRR